MLIPEGVAIWYLWGNGQAPHYPHPRLKNVINVIFFKGHHQSFKTNSNQACKGENRLYAIFEQQIACKGCLWSPMKAGSRF